MGRTDKRTFNPIWQMPKLMGKDMMAWFSMRLYEPAGGWTTDGVLRIQSEISLGDAAFTATVNGVPLKPLPEDPGEPYTSPYTTCLGTPDERRCFAVPRTVLKGGEVNEIVITQTEGKTTFLSYLDLAIR